MDLRGIIEEFETNVRPKMIAGDAYYRRNNLAINSRRKTFYSITQHRDLDDCTKANHRIASGFTPLLVDQKVYYSINKSLVINGIDDNNIINISKFKKTLKKLGKNASNEIYSVLYWYIENNELKYKVMKSQQMILVYNADDNEILDAAIRVYTENGYKKADVIDDTYTTYFMEVDGKWVADTRKPPVPHLVQNLKSNGVVLDSKVESWGRVPVSVLYNNDIHQTDLEMFRTFVDMYDIVISDFGNNLEDFQELYWVLKGYNGQDAAEFMTEFKKSRILKVSSDGDAKQAAQEVPFLARQTMLNILKQDIYRFGMGVDPDSISGDTTNITIKALFANLDLKANGFEEEIQDFMDQCLYFINRFLEIQGRTGETIEDLTVAFDRSTILNKQEIIEMILKQEGFRAKEKLLAEHPDVTDVEEELRALDAERKKQLDALGGQLGFEDGDE